MSRYCDSCGWPDGKHGEHCPVPFVEKLTAEVTSLRDELTWYADDTNWTPGREYNHNSITVWDKSNSSKDMGARARAALEAKK